MLLLCFSLFISLVNAQKQNVSIGLFNALSYSEVLPARNFTEADLQYNLPLTLRIQCGLSKDLTQAKDDQVFVIVNTTGNLFCGVSSKPQADASTDRVDSLPNVQLKARYTDGVTVTERLLNESGEASSALFVLNSRPPTGTDLSPRPPLSWAVTVSPANQTLTRDTRKLFSPQLELLDEDTVPYIRWNFGDPVTSAASETSFAVTKDPCNPAITLLFGLDSTGAIFIGRTIKHDWSDVKWFKNAPSDIAGQSCAIVRVAALVRFIYVHTSCGVLVSNDLLDFSTGRRVIFKKNAILTEAANDPSSAISDYCYLRRGTETIPYRDSIAFRAANKSLLISTAPFGDSSTTNLLAQYKNFRRDVSPNAKYRRWLFSQLSASTDNLVATFRNAITRVYYMLVKKADGSYVVYSQGSREMEQSIRSARPLLVAKKEDALERFFENPITGDLFVTGKVIYALLNNGPAFRKIGDITKLTGKSCTVKNMLFSQNGMKAALVIADTENPSSIRLYEGPGHFGPFVKVKEFTTAADKIYNGEDLLFDKFNKLQRQTAISTSVGLSTTPSEANVDALIGSQQDYSIVGYTSRHYFVFEWKSNPIFSQSDVGRKIIVDGSDGVVINYWPGTKDIANDGRALTGLILVEQLSGFTKPAEAPVSCDLPDGDIWIGDTAWSSSLFNKNCKRILIPDSVKLLDSDTCSYSLTPTNNGPRFVTTDWNNSYSFGATLKRQDGRGSDYSGGKIAFQASNPWRLNVLADVIGNEMEGLELRYDLQDISSSFNTDNDITILNARLDRPTFGCTGDDTNVMLTVNSGCPKGSRIEYDYPDGQLNSTVWENPKNFTNIVGDRILGDIPPNYRPPSSKGHAYTNSTRVYNYDPAAIWPKGARNDRNKYQLQLSRCPNNATKREQCGCSTLDARSFKPADSECLTKAVFLPHPGDHYFAFREFRGAVDRGILGGLPQAAIPMMLTEVNNRTDFDVAVPPDMDNSSMSFFESYFGPSGFQLFVSNTTIRFIGTGLFHFEVRRLPMQTYCDMVTHMVFFLYQQDLPFPLGPVYQCWMALGVALWLFSAIKATGKKTLLDYQAISVCRFPDRVPLRDPFLRVAPWDYVDIEIELDKWEPRPVEKEAAEEENGDEDA